MASGASVVGVHCTHGRNRSGAAVVSWMVSRLGIGREEATRRVEAARGPVDPQDLQFWLGHVTRSQRKGSVVAPGVSVER